MFPLHSLRAEFFQLYGFDPFFPSHLDKDQTEIAFLMPQSIYESKDQLDIVGFLTQVIARLEWFAECITWHESKSYSLGDRTYLLGPHVHFQLTPRVQQDGFNRKVQIHIPNLWSLVQVSYDDVKPPGSYNTFNIFLCDAAFPADYQRMLEHLKHQAKEAVLALET